jgi:CDP-diacylglycerol--glycerol-3-phosphate 3-phosphatidyltransferase
MAPRHAPPARPARRAKRRGTGRPRLGGARGREGRASLRAAQRRELVRDRLIESRLTPNAISLTGLALNVVAAVLVWERLFVLGGIAFIVGSVMDTLDGR